MPLEQLQLVIASNKSDLENLRIVTRAEAENFALSVNAMHVETSAKDNVGVDELFKVLGHKVQAESHLCLLNGVVYFAFCCRHLIMYFCSFFFDS